MFGMSKIYLANCDGNLYLPILRLPTVELHCKLQEKLHQQIQAMEYVCMENDYLNKCLASHVVSVYKMDFTQCFIIISECFIKCVFGWMKRI